MPVPAQDVDRLVRYQRVQPAVHDRVGVRTCAWKVLLLDSDCLLRTIVILVCPPRPQGVDVRRLLIVLGAACVAALLAGCGGSSSSGGPSSGAPGGKTLNVDAIAKADILVTSGVGMEKWLDDTVKSAGFSGTTVDTSKGVQIRGRSDAKEELAGDPHIWQNPQNAKVMVANIEQALASADSADAGFFKANLDAYEAKLDSLDADVARQIDSLANKKLVTNHDAFGYYIDRYHLDFVGSIIPSFDTSAELSAKDVADIVAKIKATGVKAVFSESSLPPRTAETIASEAHVKVVEGSDALYGDTLGPAGSEGATYLQMVAHNTRMIVSNLSST